jgi:hypothetical protein
LIPTSGLAAANLPVKRYALFVGANQGGPGTQTLRYAQKDALKMDQVMQEIGGVDASDRLVLLDPSPDAVRSAMNTLASRMLSSRQTENRRKEFLFYYSGHSDENGLLLGNKPLSYKALRDSLQAVPADVRIAILDSCSSGAFARLKGGVQRAPFLEQDSSQMTGHAFLTSSSDNEASQESDTLEGSFFTHYLVSGLRGGADLAGDGLITLNEAYQYAFQNTLARTESTQAGPQHPSYEIQLSGTGDLILSDVQDSRTRLKLGADVAGRIYVRNQEGLLFAEVAKEAGTPLFLALNPGVYTVTAVTPQKSLFSRTAIASQGITTLSAQDFQEQDLERFAVRGADGTTSSSGDLMGFDLAFFSFGLVPGLSQPGWVGEDKTMTASWLVDYARTVRGVQVSVVNSLAESIDGFQAGGVGSVTRGRVGGAQASGIFSIAGNGFTGAQFSGVFNIANGSENDFVQGAGIFNMSRGSFRGWQSAGAINLADAVEGLQSGGVGSLSTGEVRGVQMNGVFSIAEKGIQGGQFSGVFNAAQGEDNGLLQGAGVFNLTQGTFRACQVAGAANLADTIEGFQGAGVGSLDTGEMRGTQLSGVFSMAEKGVRGVQLSGVANAAWGDDNGFVQGAGAFNLSRGTFQGVQMAGVVNVADRLQGGQIGVVNVAGNVRGVQVGLVDINSSLGGVDVALVYVSPHAFYQPLVAFDTQGKSEAVLQWGLGWFYWTIGTAGSLGNVGSWQRWGGGGVKLELQPCYWDTDAGAMIESPSWNEDAAQNTHPYLRTAVGYEVGLVGLELGAMAVESVPLAVEVRGFAGVRFLP